MSDLICYPLGTTAPISIPANGTLAVWSLGAFEVSRLTSGVNQPAISTQLARRDFNGTQFQSGVLSTTVASLVQISAIGGLPVYYAVNSADGTATPTQLANVRTGRLGNAQPTPVVLAAAGGTITGGMICAGLITNANAGAVAGTLDTGTIMDTTSNFAIEDCVEWCLVVTGTNTVTVTAAAGHTIVGTATVPTLVSARFQTRKTAANTFITTRLS